MSENNSNHFFSDSLTSLGDSPLLELSASPQLKTFTHILVLLGDLDVLAARLEFLLDDLAEDLLVDGERHAEGGGGGGVLVVVVVAVVDLVLLQPHHRLVELAVQGLEVREGHGPRMRGWYILEVGRIRLPGSRVAIQ